MNGSPGSMSVRRSSRWRCAPRASTQGSVASRCASTTPIYQTLTEMVAWLVSEGVTHVTMEATGDLLAAGLPCPVCGRAPLEVLLVNARHVKNVPGRKSDALDAVWLAELTECGLLRGSFIPPPQIAAIRELTRYRKKLIEQRASELQRLAKVLEDSGIKIDSVASTLTTVSAREMIEALINGERDPAVLADLARGRDAQEDPRAEDGVRGPLR